MNLSRRSFLKWSATLGAMGTGLMSLTACSQNASLTGSEAASAGEQIIPTASTQDCGGRCLIKAHVKDGVITRISTRGAYEEDEPGANMKACLRGRSYRKHLYHPDRLKYPMKRVGKRGEGKFEQISWEEAIDTIAKETRRIFDQYGPESRYCNVGTGDTGGVIYRMGLGGRFLSATGGHLPLYNSVSMGNTGTATPYVYGVAATASILDSLKDTKLVILWGHNTTETIFGASNYYFRQMKNRGCKFICVDPRNSNTAVAFADEWIPLLPTTDNALMDAMAYVIVSENLHDQAFLDQYVQGFDEEHMPEGVPAHESLVSYLFGKKDGVEKTPEWAEAICKVPAETIRRIAREYATTKPAALIQGWGPQRHSCGERTALGATMLASITGNVGVLGGWAGGYIGLSRKGCVGLPDVPNPYPGAIPTLSWVDAIECPEKVTPAEGLLGVDKLNSPIKMLLNLAGDFIANQNPDINRTIRVLEDESLVEFIVVSDLFMTPSARYADILLPGNTFFERYNIGATWNNGDYFILSQKIVDNYYESRSEYDWLAEVADKLGAKDVFTGGKTEEEWVRWIVDETRAKYPETLSWEELEKVGISKFHYDGPRVAFQDQIEDPVNNPFPTPSGKIELFSKTLYDMHNPEIPAIPVYVPAWEGPEDELTEKYPLQLIGWKTKARDNSTFYNNPWLQQAMVQEVWINPMDAKPRNIVTGDRVKVFNDRGTTMLQARVTSRVIPGVIAAPTGSWFTPDGKGGCTNGNLNVLTTLRKTALSHGNTQHTSLVEISKL